MSLKYIFKEKAYEKKGNWLTAYNHFSTFCKDLENFDIQALNAYSMKFGRYLSEKGLKNSSINVYLKILKNFLKNNGGNPELILLKKEGDKTYPEYLNDSALLWLEKSECPDIHLKNAALFSACTGLRLRDIKILNAQHIIEKDGKTYIKLDTQETLIELSEDAKKLIKDVNPQKFFPINFSKMKSNLATWVSNANLNRVISFKIFRNSFAIRKVNRLVPAKQIQKIMGYANISSAKIFEDWNVVIKRVPKTNNLQVSI